jgi:hypothetical protein
MKIKTKLTVCLELEIKVSPLGFLAQLEQNATARP